MGPDFVERRGAGRSFKRVLLWAILIVAAILYLVPLTAMVFTSLKSMAEITGLPPFEGSTILTPPMEPTLAAWREAWSDACISVDCQGLKGYFANSLVMVTFAVAITVAFGAVNGYVLSKWRFRYDTLIFGLILFGCFIPFQIVLIPIARLLGFLGLAGSMTGLVFVHVVYGISFATMFFRNFYVIIPDEIISAARIDGAGFWAIFRLIVVPVSGPIAIVAVIFLFTNVWNDFLFGATFAGAESRPLMVALNNLVSTSTGTVAYNVNMAAAMIAALPTMLVYIVAGRYFVRGLMAGAVKG